MHEPLVIVPERLTVPRILESCLSSSLVNKVNMITSELVLRGFVVCLDTGGDHGDFRRHNDLCPVHQEDRCLPRGPT
jgi:hypothetical protein